jgi:hypothetical protein
LQKGETFANAIFLVEFDKERTHFECVGQNLRSLLHINEKKMKVPSQNGVN